MAQGVGGGCGKGGGWGTGMVVFIGWLRSWDGCVHDGLWNMHGWGSRVAETTAKSSSSNLRPAAR